MKTYLKGKLITAVMMGLMLACVATQARAMDVGIFAKGMMVPFMAANGPYDYDKKQWTAFSMNLLTVQPNGKFVYHSQDTVIGINVHNGPATVKYWLDGFLGCSGSFTATHNEEFIPFSVTEALKDKTYVSNYDHKAYSCSNALDREIIVFQAQGNATIAGNAFFVDVTAGKAVFIPTVPLEANEMANMDASWTNNIDSMVHGVHFHGQSNYQMGGYTCRAWNDPQYGAITEAVVFRSGEDGQGWSASQEVNETIGPDDQVVGIRMKDPIYDTTFTLGPNAQYESDYFPFTIAYSSTMNMAQTMMCMEYDQ